MLSLSSSTAVPHPPTSQDPPITQPLHTNQDLPTITPPTSQHQHTNQLQHTINQPTSPLQLTNIMNQLSQLVLLILPNPGVWKMLNTQPMRSNMLLNTTTRNFFPCMLMLLTSTLSCL